MTASQLPEIWPCTPFYTPLSFPPIEHPLTIGTFLRLSLFFLLLGRAFEKPTLFIVFLNSPPAPPTLPKISLLALKTPLTIVLTTSFQTKGNILTTFCTKAIDFSGLSGIIVNIRYTRSFGVVQHSLLFLKKVVKQF